MHLSIEEYWHKNDDDNFERLNTLKLYRQLNINIENYMIDWLIHQLDLKISQNPTYSKDISTN
ncbi:hypothetical protein HBP39_04770 [Listeria welshimeri]|uniref:Uncharacterized protein n=1 Tax=Listeria welshimeri serovar 6b (strain ATCC 35897 / DSM 20650 / CCUG 15529 / CIP 8149 / NCTC 11857 / SLCC 5334 / V8) TaxID=386043 RepID=A0AI42_LISW6|nr:hypothetical protein [Listeria welshimeri]MBC1354361.1 hypothetical protein [Listeria welshimeri]MBC1360233.1 hypothetical protein [Listeria welshimeri]MBC1369004.1 hypothetical protein [Listeria welshimeri]MBC1389341.1 hypothetical protein [Listeria welshimeri]MBC1693099.1 hypothetical protein [Listeria welshimeri]